jgi:hypothetical protein
MADLFLDTIPNLLKAKGGDEVVRDILRARFEEDLPNAVERVKDVPILMVKPEGEYLDLLVEARELYISGRFYSCVAMSGIVGERLVKDVIRASVLVERKGTVERPTEKAFDQLERVDVTSLVQFAGRVGLLSDKAEEAARKLGELRNDYAHARGKKPPEDAKKALAYLHVIVEDTVSLFAEYELQEGKFVKKAGPK